MVDRAFADKVLEVEAKINKIPLIETSVAEIIERLDDQKSSYKKIARVLPPDMAAKVLTIANSAYYYYKMKIRTVEHAIKIIGYDKLKQIIVFSMLLEHFAKNGEVENFDFDQFQRHARLCAMISITLGWIMKYKNTEDLFTVGIIHDIGKLMIAYYMKGKYRKVIEMKAKEGITESEAERKVIGFDHGEIGAMILKKYKVPEYICKAIKHHNNEDPTDLFEDDNYQLGLILRQSAIVADKILLTDNRELFGAKEKLKAALEEIRKVSHKINEISSISKREKNERLLEGASEIILNKLIVL